MRTNIVSTLLTVLPSVYFLQAARLICTTNAIEKDEVSMGTTILAVRYKDGVVVGADTRTSVSGYVSNRYAAKLTFVLDRNVDDFVKAKSLATAREGESLSTCVICRSGSAADTQHVASVVRTELVSRQLLYGIRGTVTHVAALLRNMLADSDLSASLICAGYDHELGRGVLYTILPGGTVFEEKVWAAGGSGSTYVLGHLDSSHPTQDTGNCAKEEVQPLRSEEEALEFVSAAISLAMERDGSSGGFLRMYVIDRFGKRFVSMMPNNGRNSRNSLNDKDKRIQPSADVGVSLRNFAPAAAPIKTMNSLSVGLTK